MANESRPGAPFEDVLLWKAAGKKRWRTAAKRHRPPRPESRSAMRNRHWGRRVANGLSVLRRCECPGGQADDVGGRGDHPAANREPLRLSRVPRARLDHVVQYGRERAGGGTDVRRGDATPAWRHLRELGGSSDLRRPLLGRRRVASLARERLLVGRDGPMPGRSLRSRPDRRLR
jgi:hypothetical protein